jgi:hypothetical protein
MAASCREEPSQHALPLDVLTGAKQRPLTRAVKAAVDAAHVAA